MIRLTEYRASKVPLDDQDLAYLLRLVPSTGDEDETKVIQALTPTGTPGEYMVKPGGFVGRLGLPSGSWLDIHSRFPFEDVIELIRLSGRLPTVLNPDAVPGGVAPFIVEVIAASFAREVERLVVPGLAKGYVRRRFERPPYPGQIDINRHLGTYAARPDRLVTTAKRITHDVPINQALALALDVLKRVRLPDVIAHRVAHLGGAFARIRRPPMSPAAVARLGLDRLTDRYKPALGLAELILGSQVLAPREQDLSGASVLFNMPRVWEAYVARWAKEKWPAHEVQHGYTFDLTAGGELRSEADVTVRYEGELVALYDAKYKWPGKTPKQGDVYQMVAYCTRLGIDRATLVYPGDGATRSFRVGDVEVRTLSLPVTASVAA